MAKLLTITCSLVCAQTNAFLSPLSKVPFSRGTLQQKTIFPLAAEPPAAAPLPDADDPFEAFPDGTDTVAIKELVPGVGEGAGDGDVLNCAYKGSLFKNKKEFATFPDFVFKMGSGNVMPGFDKGLRGAKAGSKRILRIPSVLAYGETGKSPKIPPNSDLEMEVEVKRITSGVMGELALIGEVRFFGGIFFLGLAAAAPLIEKAVNSALSSSS